MHPENGDVDPKNGMGLLSNESRRETVRWKAIAYSYQAHQTIHYWVKQRGSVIAVELIYHT